MLLHLEISDDCLINEWRPFGWRSHKSYLRVEKPLSPRPGQISFIRGSCSGIIRIVAMYSTGGWGLRLGLRSSESLELKLLRRPTAATLHFEIHLTLIQFHFHFCGFIIGEFSTERYPIADSRHRFGLLWLAKARHSCRSLRGMTRNCTRVSSDTEL